MPPLPPPPAERLRQRVASGGRERGSNRIGALLLHGTDGLPILSGRNGGKHPGQLRRRRCLRLQVPRRFPFNPVYPYRGEAARLAVLANGANR